MKRLFAVSLVSIGICATSIATAQSFKVDKGKYKITTPDGEVVTINKDGTFDKKATPKKFTGAKDESELKLGGSSSKEARTTSPAATCKPNTDLLLENKNIEGEAVAVTMVGTCDADLFNVNINATKHGIDVTGTGELRLSESVVQAKDVGISLTGSGDVVIEGGQIAAPTAISLTGTGNIVLKNTKVFGKIAVTGTGKVVDEGGNELVADFAKAAIDTSEAPTKSKKKSKK